MRTLSLSAFLITFWLLMSGHYSFLLISLGLISVLFVMIIVRRMDIVDHETFPLHVALKLPRFLVWLLADLVAANINVVKHIWRKKLTISPTLVTCELQPSSDIAKVIYANSITVTPGTVTIDLKEDSITVHALTSDALEDIRSGARNTTVKELVD